jgi:ferredoxin-NADP reductase
MSRVFPTALVERRQVAEGTVEVSFERPDSFAFKPGQYMQVSVRRLLHPDRRGRSRVFSISSCPSDEEKVSVTFRDTGSGFKRTLQDLEIGSPAMIEGPHGFYVLPERPSRPFVLVAGGIGITPFMSMLRHATRNDYDPGHPITLLYANTSKRRAAYLDELEKMARGADYLRLKKRFGPVDENVVKQAVRELDASIWMIAGPPLMVDAVRGALHALGVDPGRVFWEDFVGY